ncbi:MAG: hypothetical protein ACLFPF_07675 [Halanaerobiales bacterium]
MPDFWTHIIGGESILEYMEKEYPRQFNKLITVVKDNQELFNFACQGPDFFFYNDFWPWIREKRAPSTGALIQLEKVRDFLLGSIEYLSKSMGRDDYPYILTYFTGFLCHYFFDKNLHPFIIRKSLYPEDHKRLEILIDCYYVEKIWNNVACNILPTKAINSGQHLPLIVIEYYQTLIEKKFMVSGVEYIDDSYRDMKTLLMILYKPGLIRRAIFNILNRFTREDINSLFYPRNPDYSLLTDEEWLEVDRLYQLAVVEGSDHIKLVMDYLDGRVSPEDLAAAFSDINFEGD